MLRLAEQMIDGNQIRNSFTFSFRKGAHKGETYTAISMLPTFVFKAICNNVFLQVTSTEKSCFSYVVGLDVEKRLSIPVTNSSLLERNFTKAFIAELGPEDWEVFQSLNRSTRMRISEEFTDFASLEVDFTEYVAMIEQEKLTLSYNMFFAYSARPEIIYEGEKYYLDDQYYIGHSSESQECLLTFLVHDKEDILDADNPKSRFAWLFYETQALEPLDQKGDLDKAFFAEVKKQLPDLASLVKQRHANLRLVYENYCKRANLHFPKVKTPPPSQGIPSDQDTENRKYVLLPKVGRNDPCPCGSGKKYKKCCMS